MTTIYSSSKLYLKHGFTGIQEVHYAPFRFHFALSPVTKVTYILWSYVLNCLPTSFSCRFQYKYLYYSLYCVILNSCLMSISFEHSIFSITVTQFNAVTCNIYGNIYYKTDLLQWYRLQWVAENQKKKIAWHNGGSSMAYLGSTPSPTFLLWRNLYNGSFVSLLFVLWSLIEKLLILLLFAVIIISFIDLV